MRVTRRLSTGFRVIVGIGLVAATAPLAALATGPQAPQKQNASLGHLAGYLPSVADTVVSLNCDATRRNESVLAVRKDAPELFKKLNKSLSRELGIPLQDVTRLTLFSEYRSPPASDWLLVVQTRKPVSVSKAVTQLKAAAKMEGSKVNFQLATIKRKTVYSSTIDGAPWSSFCIVADRTLVIESRGDRWIREFLAGGPRKRSKLLRLALSSAAPSDLVYLATDLSKFSAKDNEPLFPVFHGNGPFPAALGRPQLFELRISGRKETTVAVEVRCKSPKGAKTLEKWTRDGLRLIRQELDKIDPKTKAEFPLADRELRGIFSQILKSLRVKNDSVRVQVKIPATLLRRGLKSTLRQPFSQ